MNYQYVIRVCEVNCELKNFLDKLTMLAYKILDMGIWTPEEIRAFRKQHKLSKRALAEIVGVSKNYIYFLEKGVRNPSKTLCLLLDRIAKELQEKRKDGDIYGTKSKRSL